MPTSALAKRNHCVIRIGSTASNPEAAVNAVVDSFANELNFGTYTINDVDSLSNNFQNGQTFKTITTTESLIEQYGEKPFYDSVTAFNSYFKNEQIKKLIENNKDRYPNLVKRISAGFVFTPIEVAEFIVEYQYVPVTLKVQSNTVTPKLSNEVENFYSNGISGGILDSFCSLMPSVFGAIDGFFDALNDIQNLISSIKSFSFKDLALKSLIDKIKDQIINVIERVIENVKDKINNFSIENIIQKVTTALQENIVARFYDIKEKALNFFSPENIKSFLDKVKGMIDYAINLFKNPSLDEIQFIIYRFCNFGVQIENGINGLINPLEEYTGTYQSSLNTIQSSSNRNTANAIRAGAIRVSPEERSSIVSAATGSSTSSQTPRSLMQAPVTQVPSGDIKPFSANEFNNITQYNEGKGDSRVTFVGGTLRPAITKEGKKPPAWRWENQSIKSRAKIMRIQARFGKQLKIVSARRTYQEQKALYDRDLQRNGGRPSGKVAAPGNSKHEQGHAYDIKWDGYPSGRKEFLEIAIEEGMRGIGGYTSFVHIDEGPPRFWGSVDGVKPS